VKKTTTKLDELKINSSLLSCTHLDISKIIYNSTKDNYKYITDRDPFFMFNGSFWVECNADIVLRTHINELLERYKNYEIN